VPSLDEKMSSMAESVLKRSLSEDEKNEILRISDAVGMRDVQSFLHLLMVFKLHEDVTRGQFDKLESLKERLDEKFREMSELSENITKTLERSIERILGDGAREIGRDMGTHIAEGAKEALGARDDYQSLRGQICVVCMLSFVAAVAYRLGMINAVGADGGYIALDSLFLLPAGWWVFFCCSLYTFMWAYDHWKLVKKSAFHKGILAVQCLILAALILSIL
jgi:ElaB/YqjD/DUF883 family membrane-anchored ribosome-binding protein